MAAKTNKKFSKRFSEDDLLGGLEAILQHTLEPVHPRHEFVQGLHTRLNSSKGDALIRYNRVKVDEAPRQGIFSFVVISAGVLGGLIVVIAGIKTTLSILEALRAIRGRKIQGESSLSFNQTAS